MGRQRIVLQYGEVKKLQDEFGVSRGTVMNALRFASDSETCQQIRLEALNRGGVTLKSKNEAVQKR